MPIIGRLVLCFGLLFLVSLISLDIADGMEAKELTISLLKKATSVSLFGLIYTALISILTLGYYD